MRTAGYLALGIIAIGCAVLPAKAGPADNSLTVASEQELSTVDLYYNIANEAGHLSKLVWDNLLYYDGRTGEVKPALADSYRFVDPLTIEFKLRENVKFHDGSKFGPDDVIATLNHVRDPKAGVLRRDDVNWLKSVERVDDRTVRVSFTEPSPGALVIFGRNLPIYKKGTYDTQKGLDTRPIGTGPYRIVELQPGGTIRLERFAEHYEGSPKGKAEIQKVVWRTIKDKSTQMAELLGGGVEWIAKVEPDQAEDLKAIPHLKVESLSTHRVSYLVFDAGGVTPNKALEDVRVRRAIAHAIDREGIAKSLVRGASEVVHGFCVPGDFGCHAELPSYDYNPAKARALLAEAGLSGGFDVVLGAWRDRPIAEAIIANLRAVGIRANLRFAPLSAIVDQWIGKQLPMVFGARGVNYDDVAAFAPLFFDMGSRDMARDQQVADFLKAGREGSEPNERKENYRKALERIAAQVYGLPLFTYSTNFAYRANLEVPASKDEQPPFYRARWKK
jgi:peptide/nickel transport system substrate-binding protein